MADDWLGGEDLSRMALDAFRAQHPQSGEIAGLYAGSPSRVKRLDRPGEYFLVPIRDGLGLRGVVQVDAERRRVESSAAILDPATELLLRADTALAAALRSRPNLRDWRTPFLGWRPCRESFDSMRPLWVIRHAEGELFVTQSGGVFETLTSGRGGHS